MHQGGANVPEMRIFLIFLVLSLPLSAQPEAADWVFKNGSIYTLDSARSWARGLAVKDGLIVFVGSNNGVSDYIGPETRVTDLEGRMLLPGFHDSHVHPVSGGVELLSCNLNGVDGREAVFKVVGDYARKHPDRPWVVGGGWVLPDFPPGQPTREQLDQLVPDRPAFITSSDAHTAWVNSKALELAGVDASTLDPSGGQIVRDAQGRPTGLLREEAIALVTRLLPETTESDYLEGLRRGLGMAASFGITSMVEANATDPILRVYARYEREGKLNARVFTSLSTSAEQGPEQVERLKRLRAEFSDLKRVRPLGAKVFVDGVIEGHTAALLEPYRDEPKSRGVLIHAPQALSDLLLALDEARFHIHVHAIGDRGIRLTLDGLERARQQNGEWDSRHQLAHLQLLDPADVPRFRSLGLVADFQPLWAFADRFITELTEPRIGPERSRWLYPLRSLYESGAVVAAGSDWSVTSMNPLRGIEVALTRRDPDLGPGPAWIPEQRLALPEILAAYTIKGAYVMHQERLTGSLEAGKFADLVVLEKNLFEIPAHEIGEVKVWMTVFEGRQVYPQP